MTSDTHRIRNEIDIKLANGQLFLCKEGLVAATQGPAAQGFPLLSHPRQISGNSNMSGWSNRLIKTVLDTRIEGSSSNEQGNSNYACKLIPYFFVSQPHLRHKAELVRSFFFRLIFLHRDDIENLVETCRWRIFRHFYNLSSFSFSNSISRIN